MPNHYALTGVFCWLMLIVIQYVAFFVKNHILKTDSPDFEKGFSRIQFIVSSITYIITLCILATRKQTVFVSPPQNPWLRSGRLRRWELPLSG
jgi:hypothetical protein